MNQVNEAETIIKNEGNLNGNGEEMDQRQVQEEEEEASKSSANGSGSGNVDGHGHIDRDIETETEKDSQTLSEFIIDGSEDERSIQSCEFNFISKKTTIMFRLAFEIKKYEVKSSNFTNFHLFDVLVWYNFLFWVSMKSSSAYFSHTCFHYY